MAINLERFISNACCNSCQSFYDHYVEANVRFRSRLGMKAVIIRRQLGHCCEWCASLAGIYDPSNAPDDIYRRHENCRCLVTSKTEKGYQDVWNKKIYQTQKQARFEKLKEIKEIQIKTKSEKHDKNPADKNYYQNVYKEYLQNAIPKKGNIDFETPDLAKRSLKELEITNILHDTFGGDIFLIDDRLHQMEGMSPDSFWLDNLWEFKNPTSYTSVDTRIRKGLKQIKDNPGGIVLYLDEELSIESTIETISHRMRTSEKRDFSVDVILIQKGKVIRVLRYKK